MILFLEFWNFVFFRMRKHGAKTVLITNSEYEYTDVS